jgi:hypothetical protein
VKASYIAWSSWFLAFVVLEFLGYFRVVPWVTLSETVWKLESVADLFKIIFLAGLVVLTVHIVFRWP